MHEFASGVINVLEKNIFDKLDQERMLNSPDYKRAFEVLYDTDLGQIITKQENLEKIFEQDFIELKNTLQRILENQDMLTFLFLRFDVSNIKLAIKKLQQKNLTASPLPWSSTPYQTVEKHIFALLKQKWPRSGHPEAPSLRSRASSGRRIPLSEHKPRDSSPACWRAQNDRLVDLPQINPWIKKLIQQTLNNLNSQNPAPDEIELAADKAYAKIKLELAKKISPLLRSITKKEIDLLNLKNLIYFKEKKQGKEIFIKKGNFSCQELLAMTGPKALERIAPPKKVEKFLEIFQITHILEDFQREKSLTALEKNLQNFLSEEIFKEARQTAAGTEKILSFFQKKINAHNNIRLILFAKLNNLAVSTIQDKLLLI